MSLKPKDTPELSHFEWEDPFLLENQLNEDERMIRDAVRAYAQEKLQPRAIDAFANDGFGAGSDPPPPREMPDSGCTTKGPDYAAEALENAWYLDY